MSSLVIGLAVQIAALVIAAVLLVGWVPSDRRAPLRVRYSALLPCGLAAMIIACGIASATRDGGVFNLLAASAAFSAGSDTDPVTGYTVTGLGIAAGRTARRGTGGGDPAAGAADGR
jgi:hypothetical protein